MFSMQFLPYPNAKNVSTQEKTCFRLVHSFINNPFRNRSVLTSKCSTSLSRTSKVPEDEKVFSRGNFLIFDPQLDSWWSELLFADWACQKFHASIRKQCELCSKRLPKPPEIHRHSHFYSEEICSKFEAWQSMRRWTKVCQGNVNSLPISWSVSLPSCNSYSFMITKSRH